MPHPQGVMASALSWATNRLFPPVTATNVEAGVLSPVLSSGRNCKPLRRSVCPGGPFLYKPRHLLRLPTQRSRDILPRRSRAVPEPLLWAARSRRTLGAQLPPPRQETRRAGFPRPFHVTAMRKSGYALNLRRRAPKPTKAQPSRVSVAPPSGTFRRTNSASTS